jgi:hypothetical protein
MGKIRVQDLATMMGISNQDLVFKLKSIGVRVEGDDASIDTDIVQAILQGKKLPHPREVILRDEPAAPVEAARRRSGPSAPAPHADPEGGAAYPEHADHRASAHRDRVGPGDRVPGDAAGRTAGSPAPGAGASLRGRRDRRAGHAREGDRAGARGGCGEA